jgi:hypothetical protein
VAGFFGEVAPHHHRNSGSPTFELGLSISKVNKEILTQLRLSQNYSSFLGLETNTIAIEQSIYNFFIQFNLEMNWRSFSLGKGHL